MIRPIKIGVTGTHSTGKSSFLQSVQKKLDPILRVHRISDLAVRARDLGFPILKEHSYESTLWIISECMRLEAEASLVNDIILIDRPVIDALGYLLAALRCTGRSIGDKRRLELEAIVKAHSPEYDLLINTSLDKAIALGANRDQDIEFREAAASSINALISKMASKPLVLTSSNQQEIVQQVIDFIARQRSVDVSP